MTTNKHRVETRVAIRSDAQDAEDLALTLADIAQTTLHPASLTLALALKTPQAIIIDMYTVRLPKRVVERYASLTEDDPLLIAMRVGQSAYLTLEDGRSRLAVPISLRGTAAGGIAVDLYSDSPGDDTALTLLAMLARFAAGAIDQWQQRRTMERELELLQRVSQWQRALIAGMHGNARERTIGRLLATVADELEHALPHHRLAVYVTDVEPGALVSIYVREDGRTTDETCRLVPGQGLVGAAVLDGAPLLVNNAQFHPRATGMPDAPPERLTRVHVLVTPLLVDAATVGALSLTRSGDIEFSQDEFDVFAAFVQQFALTLQTVLIVTNTVSVQMATIRALASAIDAKDPLTRGHSQRVARYAGRLARMLSLPDDAVSEIELAGSLHDIGKIAVPDEVLSKPDRLTSGERVMMMAHASVGADILATAESRELDRIVPLVRHHHEWHHGGGYPDGISGSAIPLGAAIIAVADAFDTMTTDRPYRPALSVSDALTEVRRSAGTQFHPKVALAMVDIVETGLLVQPDATLDFSSDDDLSYTDVVSRITPVDVRPVSVLHRIAGAIASIRDLPVFLGHVVTIISEELNYANVSILAADTDHDFLIVQADTGPHGESMVGTRVPIERSITGSVYRSGAIVNVPDTQTHSDYFLVRAFTTRSELAVPLVIEDRVIGVINVEATTKAAFNNLDERILAAIAAQIAPALELATIHDEFKHAAQRDGLTGIYNHAAFYAHLNEMLAGERQFALFIFDVEGLKRMNDTAGHLAGDSVLRRVASTLDLATRPEDMVARYGGDEFAVISEGIGVDVAVDMALRLQANVSHLTWGPQAEQVSISVGVAISGIDGSTATELVECADKRMYDTRTETRSRLGITTELRERRVPRRRPDSGNEYDLR